MQKIGTTLTNQFQRLTRRAAGFTAHKARTPKKPRPQKLRLFGGAVIIPNNIFEIMMTDPELDKRELKILMLIIRLTIGLNKRYCVLRNRDFEAAGVRETHSQKLIASLINKEWIEKPPTLNDKIINPAPAGACYTLHRKRWENQQRDSKLSHLIAKKIHQNGWRK